MECGVLDIKSLNADGFQAGIKSSRKAGAERTRASGAKTPVTVCFFRCHRELPRTPILACSTGSSPTSTGLRATVWPETEPAAKAMQS